MKEPNDGPGLPSTKRRRILVVGPHLSFPSGQTVHLVLARAFDGQISMLEAIEVL